MDNLKNLNKLEEDEMEMEMPAGEEDNDKVDVIIEKETNSLDKILDDRDKLTVSVCEHPRDSLFPEDSH